MKKDLAIIGGLFLVVIILLIFGKGFSSASYVGFGTTTQTSSQNKNQTNISIGSLSVKAQVASSTNDRKKGLSGRDSLSINEGMLFVFDNNGKWTIWMKNMKFPIDIIWIDETPAGEKKIVDIAVDAVPQPGKKDSELKRYLPQSQARYVLEINAGLANLNNIKVGDAVNFEL